MIPDPPEPLLVLPAVDRLEVVVPAGSALWRGLGLLGVLLMTLLGAWLALGVLLSGLFAAGLVSTGFFLALGFVSSLLLVGPALGVLAGMQVMLGHQQALVRADRRGVAFGRELVLWEAIAEVRADGDGVALMMRDGTWHDVMSEVPPAAAWWLAATLASLHDQATQQAIDEDGLQVLRAHRQAATEQAPAQSAWKPILPWVPSQKGLLSD